MSNDETFELLDQIAVRVAKDDLRSHGALSTGEQLYVALAANRPELTPEIGYHTIATSLRRMDRRDRQALALSRQSEKLRERLTWPAK